MFYQPLKPGNERIAIVDGYSVGALLAPRLNALGYQCFHIQSTPLIPSAYLRSFESKDYSENILFSENDIKDILTKLKNLNISAVIAGTESGVELADFLSESLKLKSNGTKLSAARRNKYLMIEALKKQKIKTASHCKSNQLGKILRWQKELNSWPVVVKQLKSAGTEKVFFCNSDTEIANAFHKIIKEKDFFGNKNVEVLAESYLQGTQYLVNVVSIDGKYLLSDLWEFAKKDFPGASVVHDYLKLLPCSFDLKNQLMEYTSHVLDALNIQHGPSHNEVFWTMNGPILVESGARMMGAVNPKIIADCIGRSQLDLILAALLQPERFTIKDLCDYHLSKHFMVKFLISKQTGKIKQINHLEKIKSLPSYIDITLYVAAEADVVRTIDLFTSPGVVYLSHTSEQQMMQDYQTIAEIEGEMFNL